MLLTLIEAFTRNYYIILLASHTVNILFSKNCNRINNYLTRYKYLNWNVNYLLPQVVEIEGFFFVGINNTYKMFFFSSLKTVTCSHTHCRPNNVMRRPNIWVSLKIRARMRFTARVRIKVTAWG